MSLSALVGALAIGLMVVVLVIAIFSLIVTATIPMGRFVERRRARLAASDDAGGDDASKSDA